MSRGVHVHEMNVNKWMSVSGLALADRQFVIGERISQMTKGNVTAFVNLTKALKRLKVLECSRN